MVQSYLMYIKIMVHRKRFYLWNLIVPILAATLLFVVTSNVNQMEEYVKLSVGVVKADTQSHNLTAYLSAVKDMNQKQLFEVCVITREEAERMLNENELDAFVVEGERLKLYSNQTGVSQSILSVLLKEYQKGIKERTLDHEIRTNEGMGVLCADNTMIYLYVLIGVCCVSAISFGYYLAELLLASQSNLAKRMLSTPVSIFSRFITGIMAAVTVDLFCVILVMCFIRYVLGYNFLFENNMVWGITMAGILQGILIGYVVRSLLAEHKMWKDPIAMTLIILLGFLAGIVRSDVRYVMYQTASWAKYLNPVALVSDGLFALYYHGDEVSYYIDIIALSAVSAVLLIGALLQTGRRAYERL